MPSVIALWRLVEKGVATISRLVLAPAGLHVRYWTAIASNRSIAGGHLDRGGARRARSRGDRKKKIDKLSGTRRDPSIRQSRRRRAKRSATSSTPFAMAPQSQDRHRAPRPCPRGGTSDERSTS